MSSPVALLPGPDIADSGADSLREADSPDPVVIGAGGWLGLALRIAAGALGIGLALALAMVGLVIVASPAEAAVPRPAPSKAGSGLPSSRSTSALATATITAAFAGPALAAPGSLADGSRRLEPATEPAASAPAGGASGAALRAAPSPPTDAAVLWLERCDGMVAAPLLASETSITVTGPVLRARVRQQFVNTGADATGTALAADVFDVDDIAEIHDDSAPLDDEGNPVATEAEDEDGNRDPARARARRGAAVAAADDDDDDFQAGGHDEDAAAEIDCGAAFIEATYLFPLADGAAVDRLRLVIGDRVVEGRIETRDTARQTHAAARAAGRRSALVEARRPNAFTTRVANIAPGETITVEIEYQQTLAPTDGVWQLRFPTVLTPRYGHSPDGGDLAQPRFGPTAPFGSPSASRVRSTPASAPMPTSASTPVSSPRFPATVSAADIAAGAVDADVAAFRLAGYRPAVAGPAERPLASVAADPRPDEPAALPMGGRFRLTLAIDAGIPIVAPRSMSHRITTRPPAGAERDWRIVVDEAGPGDRDFVLEWQARDSGLPRAGLRLERFGDETYGLLIVDPPRGADAGPGALRRETTFVIDTSGSMGGPSIEQARAALLFALDRLRPGDAFNLIAFSDRHRALFDAPVAVDERSVATARRWVRALRAGGGTEMSGAIAAALDQPAPRDRLGQVIFITDGAVDYEDALVGLIDERIGERRLFTVAIGSAPNDWFLRKAAERGGGLLTRIGSTAEVERRMAALFDRLARPASTDLAIEVSGARLLDPVGLPRDLYAGDPLVAVFRLAGEPTAVTLSGHDAGPWQMVVETTRTVADDAGLHALWASREIEALDDERLHDTSDPVRAAELKAKATRLALDHHLVSRHTSLVAVDDRPVRSPGEPLSTVATPAPLPAGWALPQTATPARLEALAGALLLIVGFALLCHRRVCRWLATVGGRPR